jgi:hypothetical protein
MAKTVLNGWMRLWIVWVVVVVGFGATDIYNSWPAPVEAQRETLKTSLLKMKDEGAPEHLIRAESDYGMFRIDHSFDLPRDNGILAGFFLFLPLLAGWTIRWVWRGFRPSRGFTPDKVGVDL